MFQYQGTVSIRYFWMGKYESKRKLTIPDIYVRRLSRKEKKNMIPPHQFKLQGYVKDKVWWSFFLNK